MPAMPAMCLKTFNNRTDATPFQPGAATPTALGHDQSLQRRWGGLASALNKNNP